MTLGVGVACYQQVGDRSINPAPANCPKSQAPQSGTGPAALQSEPVRPKRLAMQAESYIDRQPRVILDQPVSLIVTPEGLEVPGRVRNLSKGGAYIVDLADHPPVSSRVHLSFALPGGEDRNVLDAEATVLRSTQPGHAEEPEGIAVQFEQVDEETLAAFIHKAVSDGIDSGDRVRLRLDTHDAVITTHIGEEEGDRLVLECDLPFLCIGSSVQLQRGPDEPVRSGILSWVATHTPPSSAYPRIHLGVSLDVDSEAVEIDVLPSVPSRLARRQDRTELVKLPDRPAADAPPRRFASWVLPVCLSLVLAGGLAAGVQLYTHRYHAPTQTILPRTPQLVAPAIVPLPQPVAVPTGLPSPISSKILTSETVLATEPVLEHPGPAGKRMRRHQRAIRVYLTLARRAHALGQVKRARRHALRVLARDPGNVQAAELLAETARCW